MPRMSLWSDRKGNDYKFIDEVVRSHLEHGGTSLLVHKYLSPADEDGDPKNPPIEDLLFMENRVRKYDDVIYELRGSMVIIDQDYDLSQFGLFLGSDQTIFTVHINSMIQMMGRKIMAGDVIELPFQRDDLQLDDDSPATNQYWVVQEATREAGGYDAGWRPHLWRIKAKQMQDSVEFADIFGTGEDADDLKNILSTYNSDLAITDGVLEEAEQNVPGDYYDIDTYHILNTHPDLNIPDIESGFRFPVDPEECQYFLRVDYSPKRMFQYVDNKWYLIQDPLPEECAIKGLCNISDLGYVSAGSLAIANYLNDLGIITEEAFTALTVQEGILDLGDIDEIALTTLTIDEGILDLGVIIEEGIQIPVSSDTGTIMACDLHNLGRITEEEMTALTIEEGVLDLGVIIEEGIQIPVCAGNDSNGWQVGNILHKHYINNTRTYKDSNDVKQTSKVNLSKVVKPRAE